MTAFVLRRFLALGPVLLGVAVVVFFAVHAIPGDAARLMLGEKATPAALASLRAELGLDQPLVQQFFSFLVRLLHGDLGRSIQTGNTVAFEIAQRFPATVELAVAALAIALLVGIPLGVGASVRRGRLLDALATVVSLGGVSLPIFWVGLMLMAVFAAGLGWLPFSQRADILVSVPPVTGFLLIDSLLAGDTWAFGDALAHLVLPALTLATVPLAIVAKMTRGAMLDTLGTDYVRAAKAKGLPPRRIYFKHALLNASLPIVTVVGLQLGMLLSGAIMTETIFAWPGIGSLAVASVFARDFPVLQGCALVFATSFVLVNLATDLLYHALDPRLRQGAAEGRA